MNHEQWGTQEKVDREFKKADAALELIPTLEAKTRRESLATTYANVRNAVAESERADATARDARGDKKDADQKVVNVVDAVSTVIAAARAADLLPPIVTDGSASSPESAEQLIKGLANVPEGGLLLKALQYSVQQASTVQPDADQKQLEAERAVYLAHSEFFKGLHDTHGYIKLNTDVGSLPRQRLKQRRSRRRSSEDSAEAKSAVSKPAAPKSDGEKVG